MISQLKNSVLMRKVYARFIRYTRAYFPVISAKLQYYIAYSEKLNLKQPRSFSEKLLWLSLNTYRNNPLILRLSDKYLVRNYIKEKVGEEILNELYAVWEYPDEIKLKNLPESFVLKVSQGCTTNLLCTNKADLNQKHLDLILKKWATGQYLYDKTMADVGGTTVKDIKKYYICEKYLHQEGQKIPIDYKFYCFNGIPKAILVIGDRFGDKTGVFMTPEWEFLSELKGGYQSPKEPFARPESLNRMIEVSKKLSEEFPFVRVDLYDIAGKTIFGELTFFPSGCVKMQETDINGISMGDLLDISRELEEQKMYVGNVVL